MGTAVPWYLWVAWGILLVTTWWSLWRWLKDRWRWMETLDVVDQLIAGLHSVYPNEQHDLAIKARSWVSAHDIRRRRKRT